MEPKIITKESFPVIGIELKTTTRDGKNFVEIPRFWEEVLQQGSIDNIPYRKDSGIVLGICLDFKNDGAFSYIIGAEVTNTENIPQGMVSKTIPSARYAVFTAKGEIPDSIQDTFRYIYREWLPNSSYQRAESAEFELYDDRSRGGEHAEADIYIPIETS